MAYQVIRAAPKVDNFTPLSDHQEQTPDSFFDGTVVLHLRTTEAELTASREDWETHPDFAALHPEIRTRDAAGEEAIKVDGVEVWVTSKHLTLWSTSTSVGIQIPYPTITIHAQDGNAVLLELNLSDANTADEDLDYMQLRITPNAEPRMQRKNSAGSVQENGQLGGQPVTELYNAISACQELNPDSHEEEDGVGGAESSFDDTIPGATGWITSENLADFTDEYGNIRFTESMTVIQGTEDGPDLDGQTTMGLGEGAGRRRGQEEVAEEDLEETKWQRTS
ncbi:hypothetical protein M433DRAFT_144106 [Acidomyces richmondensis BFW]|nr:MAG: hypothetical protein FE78DRAFT_149003 [Acidomyces sp. 'richmondensis']KYG45291.1 hypothetical protein M433DRAFT_144106 [Acidomyces richmondensis BFW]